MNLITEMSEAEKTMKIAREAIIEFEAKKSLTEMLTSEDSALQRIEEMGEVRVIPGISGRIEDLIKVDPRFKRAIEAASAGWLKAIVVEDVETALRTFYEIDLFSPVAHSRSTPISRKVNSTPP